MDDKGNCDCKFNTAIEQAIHDISNTIMTLQAQMNTLKWYEFKDKMIGSGMLQALVLVVRLLDNLSQKYDNRGGEFN